ncbi:MAG: methionyl aminopeptidase [Waddliaceae bacterium]|jgi:methionyl aminopeptidase|nr:methionyl aminopeptidase [Waddliaceae bacterium]MBT3579338.1 methionyl aminopeptidase [Waddliaceae bacterium]MBT4445469.1 methionyl aminopeptidase [Waddliaceae bacterium]MBT6928867.1 methionyl aminopeptidase [Waddliaceae bacterium]MBT7265211.1 methionyl aminopeptidase [Waddliaceae bacterium]
MIGRNDFCWCGSGDKWKKCHYPEENTSVVDEYHKRYGIIIKDAEQIEGIRASCRLAAEILDKTCSRAVAGVTTLELNDYAHKLHLDAGAIPAPLNYSSPPYPKSICTSINEVICHGIPDGTVLNDGDIVNIDVTCILEGYYGDCSRMVVVGGKTTEERQRVVDVSYECLMRSIDIIKPGALISDIGAVIEEYATSQGCSVVYQFVGHGVGVGFHEAPEIQHCSNDNDIPLVSGMTFTIEPMINAGKAEGIVDTEDHWTVKTCDGMASGQWEHTILVTDDGYEILTL